MRIIGFNDRGEAKVVDDDGKLVATGELLLTDTYFMDKGDVCELELKLVWVADK